MKFILLLITSVSSFALVDYTDSSESQSRPASSAPSVSRAQVTRAAPSKRSGPSQSHLTFDTSFKNINYKVDDKAGKVEELSLDGHIQTDYDFFVDFGVPFYTGKISPEQKDTSYLRGSSYLDLGINWLTHGSSDKIFAFDTTFGVTLPSKTHFGSGRTDKRIGVEFSRRFFNFGLSLGYDLTLTGHSNVEDEQDIGAISDLNAEIGWIVSNDIKFMVKASTIQISKSTNEDSVNRLEKDIKYSYVRPQLILTMSSNVDLKMEAIFQTRRPKLSDVSLDTKLWNLEGLYGNSLQAGLSFSI